MNRNAWSDDDRAEFDALVTDALAWTVVGDRREVFLAGLADAEQAHRLWAADVLAEFREQGTDRLLKREQAKRHPRVAIANGSTVLGYAPRVVGTMRRNGDGTSERQRSLFEYLTFDELVAKRREFSGQARALAVDITAIDRLLELRERVPDAATPAEACQRLGVSIEDWLLQAGAA